MFSNKRKIKPKYMGSFECKTLKCCSSRSEQVNRGIALGKKVFKE